MRHLFRVENIDLCGSNWPLGTKMCNLGHFSDTQNNNFDTQKMLFLVVCLNFAASKSWQNYLNFQKQVLNWPKSRGITWNQEKYAKKMLFSPDILDKSLIKLRYFNNQTPFFGFFSQKKPGKEEITPKKLMCFENKWKKDQFQKMTNFGDFSALSV